jgi:hypothetical protein
MKALLIVGIVANAACFLMETSDGTDLLNVGHVANMQNSRRGVLACGRN